MRVDCGITAIAIIASFAATLHAQPLPSWNDGPAKKAILAFVERVTKEGSPDFVPVADRIAVFDNDGTMWCEQPMYVQLAFAIDRVKALAEKNPDWKNKQPFKVVLENDVTALAASGEKGLIELIAATHAGMTTDEFDQIVREWISTARHPRFKRPYTECVFDPMIELGAYLRANGFKTYLFSGGGIDFMRVWADSVYGIPKEQVIGSSIKAKYEERDGKPVIVRLPEIDFVNDGAGKPVGLHKFIGKRPIMAFGNSDGDYEMFRYVTAGKGPRFGLVVRHTDAEREYAYDRESHFGRLDRSLKDAPTFGWTVVDMKKDWKSVFPSPR